MQEMQSIVSKIIEFAKSKKSPELFSDYVKIFFTGSIGKDFADYTIEELYNLTLSSFNFASSKPKDNFKIEIFNPTKEKDGFELPYSVFNSVNEDMPFLVDTIAMQFNNFGIEIKNIIHPILTAQRSKDGKIISLLRENDRSNESIIQFHVGKISNEEIEKLKIRISEVIESVKMVVGDWQEMTKLAKKASENLSATSSQIINGKNSFDISEAINFIDWIADNKFIFLGAIEFDIVENKGQYSYVEVKGSRLGVHRSEYEITKPLIVNIASEDIKNIVENPYIVEILKARYKSQIHRSSNAERIRIQKFDSKGKVIGEYRLIGLFTSSAYYQNPKLIPIVRHKINQVIASSEYSKNSYNYKNLLSIIESYPRDELFQIETEDLLKITTGIVAISGRSVVRLFVRNDKFSRFVSCLIFIPKDNFNTALSEKVQQHIAAAYNGEVSDVFVQIADSNLTRLHLVIRTDKQVSNVNVDKLEEEIIEICRVWNDDLKDEIVANFSDEESREVLDLYSDAFSLSYSNRFSAKNAVFDIHHINESLESENVICDLYKSKDVTDNIVELKIYSPEKKLPLSNIMPILDSFGFNVVLEHTYSVSPKGKKEVWIHYFNLGLDLENGSLSDETRDNFITTFDKIWKEETRSGHLNRLVFAANLNWRQVMMLRAYAKYLYQIGLRYALHQLSDVLVKHGNLTKLLADLFDTKFNPEFKGNREKAIEEITSQIKEGLTRVSDVTEDNVIRKFFNIIEATLRTNFYQKDSAGKNKSYISFKFDSKQILDMPLPVMHAEIFVYSTNVEGIHLRGGKVARGGLRWSDRHDDFRTEVLGLVKAQMTKNAVIVPVGSKGGFVVKKSTAGLSRDEILQNGIESYKTFLRGLLDLTDNVIDGKIVNPENVIRYDDNDPYLVVAADKGTATFSDIANSISLEYNFWLGDAFASGGSVGYDHKKMGITAKGAWVAVKRHFSEMGIDIQNEDFTCVGIGDLSGDVFGNGMLLSKHTKLIAAFNHLHIFIDPNPDAASSFAERQRMFNLPRSSWTDYDKSKISKGGGVFERSAKTITLSPEAMQALAIEKSELTPIELISSILKAPVDLLWNGGIGTYVKASDESHLDVGDRVNDILRVNGNQLRCKVVGEGGNLGFTQKGRIEASLNGVRMNTDAMDNSAGVDCSDHEVNIKIAMTAAMKAGKVTLEERNKILEQMTDEVSELVLNDNKNQTGAISMAYSGGYVNLGNQAQFLNSLEQSGALNRAVEFLPTNKDIIKRQVEKIGMTRPELCVMLAYSKMDLYPQILASDLPKDPYFAPELFKYFPTLMQKNFKEEIENHQLRPEIIATALTNSIVNKAGITFVNQIVSDTGFSPVDVVRNFIIVCDVFELDEIWDEIEQLGAKITPETKSKMFATINKILERSVVWLLRHQQRIDTKTAIIKYGAMVKQLLDILDDILASASRSSFDNKVEIYSAANVPTELAKKIAALDPLASTFDITEIATKSDFNIKTIARIYFEIGTRLNLKWIRVKVNGIIADNYWQKLSLKSILEDLYFYQMRLSSQIVQFSCANKSSCEPDKSIEFWIKSHQNVVERYDNFIAELKEQTNPDLSVFVVALSRVRTLVSN